LVYEYNRAGTATVLRAEVPLPVGEVEVAFEFERTGPHRGIGRLRCAGEVVGSAEIETLPVRQSLYGMGVGRDSGTTVSTAYEGPFEFEGTMADVVVEILEPSVEGTAPPGEMG